MRTEGKQQMVDEEDAPEYTPAEQLVPLAERDFAPVEFIETQQETIWYNPLDRDYTLDLYVGTKPMGNRHPPRSHEQRMGTRRYVIKSKDRRAIPSEFDIAVQHLQCTEYGCANRAHHCRNPKHRRVIVGGLGPHLQNLGLQNRPLMSDALNEHEAAKKAAVERAKQALLETEAKKEALVIAQAELDQTKAELEAEKKRAAKAEEQLRASPKTSQKDKS
jgi:hypothetical protein